jgi:hypothetical protein
MMDGAAVKEIAGLVEAAQARIVTDEGVEEVYSTRPLHHLPRRREEAVDVIELSSLQGVVDYLDLQKDGLDTDHHFIHVEGPRSVRVVGPLLGQGATNQRHVYMTAKVRSDPFPFGIPQAREDMQILLQTRFIDDEELARALRIIGNLATEESVRQEDDGITQRVTAKSGVARLEEKTVENPFHLAPFRTFPEVQPPASPFVLRLQKMQHGIHALLIEADGGAWKIEAVARIAEWLGERTEFQVIS